MVRECSDLIKMHNILLPKLSTLNAVKFIIFKLYIFLWVSLTASEVLFVFLTQLSSVVHLQASIHTEYRLCTVFHSTVLPYPVRQRVFFSFAPLIRTTLLPRHFLEFPTLTRIHRWTKKEILHGQCCVYPPFSTPLHRRGRSSFPHYVSFHITQNEPVQPNKHKHFFGFCTGLGF